MQGVEKLGSGNTQSTCCLYCSLICGNNLQQKIIWMNNVILLLNLLGHIYMETVERSAKESLVLWFF